MMIWYRSILVVAVAFSFYDDFVKVTHALPEVNGVAKNVISINNTNSVHLECMNPFIAVGDQCLYFAYYDQQTYSMSRSICQTLGGDLTVIDTATKLQNVISYIYANGINGVDYWIDGSDVSVEGYWEFSSGLPMPMGTPLWGAIENKQQPDNNPDEHCAQLYHRWGYLFNDIKCDSLCSPLCEQLLPLKHSDSASLPASVECPPPYIDVGGVCIAFAVWAAEGPWVDARVICQSIGGELASINDIEMLRAIYVYLHEQGLSFHDFWIGGNDIAVEGVWTWLDGQPVPMGQPFWGVVEEDTYEPNGGDIEDCIVMNASGYYFFRDITCSTLCTPLCMPG